MQPLRPLLARLSGSAAPLRRASLAVVSGRCWPTSPTIVSARSPAVAAVLKRSSASPAKHASPSATAPRDARFAPHAFDLPPSKYFAATPVVKLAYSRIASAVPNSNRSPVVLIFGWTCLKEDWHNLPVRLSELGHEVLVFDQRGLGESSLHDEVDGPYTLERLADDAASLIRHVYPNQKVHVIGYSMGGMVTQLVGARHTSLVHSLTLGCTTISVTNPIHAPSVVWEVVADHWILASRLMAPRYTQEWREANPEAYKALVDESVSTRRTVLTRDLMAAAIGEFDATPTAPLLRQIPILVMHGDRDRAIPTIQGRDLAAALPLAEFQLIEDVGHLFWIRTDQQMLRALSAFLHRTEEAIQAKVWARVQESEKREERTANAAM